MTIKKEVFFNIKNMKIPPRHLSTLEGDWKKYPRSE
jgi:hypothetical protein